MPTNGEQVHKGLEQTQGEHQMSGMWTLIGIWLFDSGLKKIKFMDLHAFLRNMKEKRCPFIVSTISTAH